MSRLGLPPASSGSESSLCSPPSAAASSESSSLPAPFDVVTCCADSSDSGAPCRRVSLAEVGIVLLVIPLLVVTIGCGVFFIVALSYVFDTETTSHGPFTALGEDTTTVFWTDPGRGQSTYFDSAAYEHSVLYTRFYWHDMEPERAQYDWEAFDFRLGQAQADHELFAFALMPFSDVVDDDTPQWLRDEMGEENGVLNGGGIWVPNHNNAVFLSSLERWIRAVGQHMDDLGLDTAGWIEWIDVGGVGFWGEWHLAVDMPEPEREAFFPTLATAQQIIDWHFDAFEQYTQHILMLCGKEDPFVYAVVSRGAGFRCNCFGNLDALGGWNHMDDMYPQRMEAFGDHWKTAPVLFELCLDLPDWQTVLGYSVADVTDIFDLGLEWHTCGFNPKDVGPPAVYDVPWQRFNVYMGYRYVLDQVSYEVVKSNTRRHSLKITSLWRNIGVAPIYITANLMWKLKSGSQTYELVSGEDLRTWLPTTPEEGAFTVEESLRFLEVEPLNTTSIEVFVCLFYQPEEEEEGIRIPIHVAVDQARLQDDECYRVG